MLPATSDLPFKVAEQTIVVLKELPVLQCRTCGADSIEDAVQSRVDEILAAVDEATELEIIRYAP